MASSKAPPKAPSRAPPSGRPSLKIPRPSPKITIADAPSEIIDVEPEWLTEGSIPPRSGPNTIPVQSEWLDEDDPELRSLHTRKAPPPLPPLPKVPKVPKVLRPSKRALPPPLPRGEEEEEEPKKRHSKRPPSRRPSRKPPKR